MVTLEAPHAGWRQFARFALVGLVSNGLLFVLYLALVSSGLQPPAAMTVSYCAGVLQTFVFNSKWSFGFTGARPQALARYATAYAVGYVVNLLALVVLVDAAGLPHQLVQGAMVAVVAVMLFLAQRYWVFPKAATGDLA